MNVLKKPARRIVALTRWVKPNPPLRLAKLAARHKAVRFIALVSQFLWLTPDTLSVMSPMRKLGYLTACILTAAGLWANATLSMSADLTALMLDRVAEIGRLSGWWLPAASKAVITAATVTATSAILLCGAIYFWGGLCLARACARFIGVTPPRRISLRYYILMISGDVAFLFSFMWLVLRAVSPNGLVALHWLEKHPFIGVPLYLTTGAIYLAGYAQWQKILRERGRQIYGEGRRPLVFSTAGLAATCTVFVATFFVARSLAA